MLSYARLKTIGVQKQGENRRVVSGVLEDELYGMQCEITVSWPDPVIETIQTRMKRFTTTRCPLAEKVFVRAEGWKFDESLDSRIKKELGREGCRHMAALIVDCCRAVARAELAADLRIAMERDPDLNRSEFVENFFGRYPGLKEYMRLR